MNKLDQRGFSHVLLVVLVIVVAVVGFAGWRVWQQQAEEEVALPGESGEFGREDGIMFTDPRINNIDIIKIADGRYRAFYHDGPSDVKSAISTDGKNFTLEPGARINGGVMPSLVQLDDGRWRMYYASGGELKSAVSQNGLDFSEEPGARLAKGGPNDLDRYGVVHPRVLRLPDGSYRLYYDGQFREGMGPFWRIMSARSQDGLTWVKDSGSRIGVDTDPNNDGDESDSREVDTLEQFKFELASHGLVRYEDGKFIMYFNAVGGPLSRSGIWRATSMDGLDFTVEKAPVLARDPQFGDEQDTTTQGGPKGVPQDAFLLEVATGTRLFFWTSDKGYQSALRP